MKSENHSKWALTVTPQYMLGQNQFPKKTIHREQDKFKVQNLTTMSPHKMPRDLDEHYDQFNYSEILNEFGHIHLESNFRSPSSEDESN